MKRTQLTEAEAIVKWIQLPIDERELSPLTPKQLELMERWNVADNLKREHMSDRKVIPMLMQKFGYSESSARRDLDCAMRVWGTRPRSDKDYLANMLVDYLTETMVKAGKAQKFGEVARIAKVIIEAAGIGKKDEQLEDPEELKKPVALIPGYYPELVGGSTMTEEDRKALFQKVLREKREKGLVELSTIAQLADSEPDGAE
jgi:hypothetical protein